MPTFQRWDNDQKTIIYSEVIGRYTLEERFIQFKSYSEMLDSVDHPVDLITNFLHTEVASGNLAKMPTLYKKNPMYNHPNAGIQVFVSDSRMLAYYMNIFNSVYSNVKDYLASSMEEAYQIIANYGSGTTRLDQNSEG